MTLSISFEIDLDTAIDIGDGVYFIPESKLYAEKDGETWKNMIFGRDIPNPINIKSQGRTPSERVWLLWNDWAKRKRV